MRLRVNSWRSTLTSLLTNVATTIDGLDTGGFNLPTVAAPDYLVIIIDPQATEGLPEIVHLTAHTSGNASGTIVRGMEGSTAVAHSAGIEILVGPTLADSRVGPDNLPNPSAYDYEFNAETSSLPSGWSWANQGTASYLEGSGSGAITFPVSSGFAVRGLARVVPSESTWTATAKMIFEGAQANNAGIHLGLRDSATGNQVVVGPSDDAGARIRRFNADNYIASAADLANLPGPFLSWQYVRIAKSGTTTYGFSISQSGVAFRSLGSFDLSAILTPDQIALVGVCSQNNLASLVFDSFRVVL